MIKSILFSLLSLSPSLFIQPESFNFINLSNVSTQISYSKEIPNSAESDVGHASSAILITTNNLDSSDFCFIYNTVNNSSLSTQTKTEYIQQHNSNTANWLSLVIANIGIIAENEELLENESSLNAIVGVGLGDIDIIEQPNIAPCTEYYRQAKTCWINFLGCLLLVGESGFGAIVCGIIATDCILTARENNPGCPNNGIAFSSSISNPVTCE